MGDAFDLAEAVFEPLIRKMIERLAVHFTCEDDIHEGVGVDVYFLDNRPFHIAWEFADYSVNLILDLLIGNIDVFAHLEGHHDDAGVLHRIGLGVVHLAYCGDGILDLLGDLGFNFAGSGTGIHRLDDQKGHLHIRHLVQRHLKVSQDAKDHKDQQSHGDEYRAFD